MRVSISPKGSLIAILAVLLPARLDHAGDLAGGCEVAQCDARQLELAVIRAGPARQLATVAHPDRRGRSEEHTSELQSLMRISYAVFCLNKQKQTRQTHNTK